MTPRPRPATPARLLVLLLCVAGPAMADVTLGRLFTTPEERAAQDVVRSGAPAGVPGAAASNPVAGPAAPPAPPPAPPAPVELNGLLRSSAGRSTVWLNQVPQNDASNHLLPGRPGATALQLRTAAGRRVILRPGQRYDVTEGRVKEVDEP